MIVDPHPHYPVAMKAKRIWAVTYLTGENAKAPVHPIKGWRISATNPNDWSTYGECIKWMADRASPTVAMGYFHDGTFTSIDLDKSRLNARRMELHRKVSETFPHHWQSLSVSGTGWHILIGTPVPGGTRLEEYGLEMYGEGRFMVESFHGQGVFAPDETGRLLQLYHELKPYDVHGLTLPNDPTSLTVADVIRRMLRAKNFSPLLRHLWLHGHMPGGNASDNEFRLLEFIAFHTRDHKITGHMGNADLTLEVFLRSACWNDERIAEKSRKRSGRVDEYLQLSLARVFGLQAHRFRQRMQDVEQLKTRINELLKDHAHEGH